jgi:anti-anti-sigma regulatory factor
MKKAGGSLRVAGTKGMVEETLKITSVDKIMHFYPSLSEASQNFQVV